MFSKDDILAKLSNLNESSLDELPRDEILKAGFKTYLVRRSMINNINDLSFDHYSPWNGTDRNGKQQKSRTDKWMVKKVDEAYVFDPSGDSVLKRLSSTHSRELGLKREIWTIQSSQGKLESNACFIYYADEDLITPECVNKKAKPSTVDAIKEALTFRTTAAARNVLNSMRIDVTPSQLSSISRSVASHSKKKTGPKPTTNFQEVYDRYLNRNKEEIEMRAPSIERNAKQKVCVCSIVGFNNAFKNFCVSLPTAEEVNVHRNAVDRLDVLVEQEANRYFETFIQHESASCTLPVGTALMIDTTFDLANEYVTIACGYTECFKNKKSKKNSVILLGYMLHSEKTRENHTRFAEFLNEMFLKYASDRILNCVVHDGEDSFRVYSEGDFLRDAVTLRCDIHRLANIKEHAKASNISPKEAQVLFFGERRRTASGVTLRKGLLQALSRKEYDALYRDTLLKLDGDLKEWLMSNKESLYRYNSMRTKLRAGFPAQYASTNVLEARNAVIKQQITRKEKAEKVMDVLLEMHRAEMKERLNAVISLPSTLECSDSLNHEIWRRTSAPGRRLFLSRFGLEGLVVPTKLDCLPAWVFEGLTINIDSFLKYVDDCTLHISTTEPDLMFIVNNKEESCTMIRKGAEKLLCYEQKCKKTKNLCTHSVVALVNLPEADRNRYIELEQVRRNNVSISDTLRSTTKPADGSKITRRGKPSSSRNYSRNYDFLVNDDNETPVNLDQDTELGEVGGSESNNVDHAFEERRYDAEQERVVFPDIYSEEYWMPSIRRNDLSNNHAGDDQGNKQPKKPQNAQAASSEDDDSNIASTRRATQENRKRVYEEEEEEEEEEIKTKRKPNYLVYDNDSDDDY